MAQVSSELLAPTRRLTRLYVSALGAVALLSVVAQLLVQHALNQQTSDAHVVNVAGRQRMLSQRVSKAALTFQVTTDPAERKGRADELAQAMALWERSHRALQHGDPAMGLPGKNTPEVTRMFQAIEPLHQSMLRDGKDLLAAVGAGGEKPVEAAAIQPIVGAILAAEPGFLSGMDRVVSQYAHEATARIERLRLVELILLCVTLGVLFLEGLYIFRPAVREIRRTISHLVQARGHLDNTVQALRAIAGIGQP
ncbi:type IV pili methyl-accepting chemotaxis transducer N-terminal domain-containing protein [Sorangium sp. So ce367]|uniref:type IV pili methyl-accepting chemotaxis transducer N-terminal domain-containing protein n=1 Tax=Sorangium sp. So ce367 TaxID=3133305 RepID=UPI003F5D6D53